MRRLGGQDHDADLRPLAARAGRRAAVLGVRWSTTQRSATTSASWSGRSISCSSLSTDSNHLPRHGRSQAGALQQASERSATSVRMLETNNHETTLQLVTCARNRRSSPMSMKPGQLERVLAGDIPCPACRARCRPTSVRIEVPERGILVPAWDDETERWQEVCHYVQYTIDVAKPHPS